mgnify:CR=1 FL=1
MSNLIVARHAGLVEWFRRRGIEGECITHVSYPEQIEGKIVFGVLPIHLAALTDMVIAVEMWMTPKQRSRELSADEMDGCGARMRAYRVEEVTDKNIYDIVRRSRA